MSSYKDLLRKQIKDIEERILKDESEKFELQLELNKLKLAEFEEDLKESDNRQLLKG